MNGTRCTACISLQSDSITGSPRCASTGAWPCPGNAWRGRDAGRLKPSDPRRPVAGDERRVLAIGADPDVGAVALRQHVEHGREVDVHAEAAQLPPLDDPLAVDECHLAGGSRREIVGEDRHRAPEHDDPAALVVRRDHEPAAEGALEAREQAREPLRRLEVPAIEHDSTGSRILEETDVGVRGIRTRQAEHQLAADHLLERHRTHR